MLVRPTNLEDLATIWRRLVTPYVTPLVWADPSGKLPLPVASGIFVVDELQHYLLTAHHVLDDINRGNTPGDPSGTLFYAINRDFLPLPASSHDIEDPYDVGLIPIPAGGQRSLRISEDFALDAQVGERCHVYGFPARPSSQAINRATQTFGLRPFSCLATIDRVRVKLRGPDKHWPPLHLGIAISHKNTYFNGKQIQNLGKLHGISGGAITVLRDRRPRLAGIIIEHRAHLIATKSILVHEIAKRLATNEGQP